MKNETVTLAREHAERLIERLSNAQMFKETTELRAAMEKPVTAPKAPGLDKARSLIEELSAVARGGFLDDDHLLRVRRDADAFLAALADPVPPAGGDVEVLAWQYRPKDGLKHPAYTERESQALAYDENPTALVDRAHVTRLQAEVERLDLKVSEYDHTCDELDKERNALKAEVERLGQALRREQNEHCTTVNARDNAEQVADEMACKIGKIFRVEIGEHSNMNCPWGIAIGVLDGEYETDSDTERERDALQSEVEQLKKVAPTEGLRSALAECARQRDALQSDLTKARELLRDINDAPGGSIYRKHIEAFLAHQSAPAAKDEPNDCAHSEANKHGCPECGEEFKP